MFTRLLQSQFSGLFDGVGFDGDEFYRRDQDLQVKPFLWFYYFHDFSELDPPFSHADGNALEGVMKTLTNHKPAVIPARKPTTKTEIIAQLVNRGTLSQAIPSSLLIFSRILASRPE